MYIPYMYRFSIYSLYIFPTCMYSLLAIPYRLFPIPYCLFPIGLQTKATTVCLHWALRNELGSLLLRSVLATLYERIALASPVAAKPN